MDILNLVPSRTFRDVDDLLAFVSIYDDRERTRRYVSLLKHHAGAIRGAVCVEGGAGLGVFSAEMAKLGARSVYAVEHNPLLAALARQRIDDLPGRLAKKIQVVEAPLQSFRPPGRVDVLLQEFYGQLLYDEDLWVLDRLKFRPGVVLPNGGELRGGVVGARRYHDRTVTPAVAQKMRGALVSGVFDEKLTELRFPVLRWTYGKGLSHVRRSIKGLEGDLLCFGVRITHDRRTVCEAGRCPNWSYVWTPRIGDRFRFGFRKVGRTMECSFRWTE